MIGNKHNRRHHPDLFASLVLIVGFALSMTLVSQAHAVARPVQPTLKGECIMPVSLSVADARKRRAVVGSSALRQARAKRCRNVSLSALRVLGIWGVFTR